ncbi:MAG: transporter related protein [Acidimicrobiales bacterium]|nr:transporter related protein [Acidimicrobiales bacterium]
MSAALQLDGFSTGYAGHPVVHDLNLEVHPGEVVALFGANGAGKTTTILGIAGELPPHAGQISLFGQSTKARLHRRARGGLALVTEERSVFMRMTVRQNLLVGRCDAKRALELFPELDRLQDRRAGLLSGGEQQMLTLARALARRPKILLFDELSLGLAPLVVTRLINAVRAAADDDGVAVLVVEQHIQRMLRSADRVYVLQRGRIVISGTPDELAANAAAVEGAYLADAVVPATTTADDETCVASSQTGGRPQGPTEKGKT